MVVFFLGGLRLFRSLLRWRGNWNPRVRLASELNFDDRGLFEFHSCIAESATVDLGQAPLLFASAATFGIGAFDQAIRIAVLHVQTN